MRTLFCIDGKVVSEASVVEGQSATVSGPPGSASIKVGDAEPATIGWGYDNEAGTFSPPAPIYRTLMTPIRFKAQFGVGEQVAIKRARAYAGEDEGKAFARDALDILFGSLDDPRLAEVDVADPSVIGGIDFCQSIGILTAERAAAIKLGVIQLQP